MTTKNLIIVLLAVGLYACGRIQELDPGYGSSTRHGDFFPYFEEILPEVSVKLFKNKVRNMDESDLVWTYSFWLRRHNEGNTDNIIKTLRSIRHDYDGME